MDISGQISCVSCLNLWHNQAVLPSLCETCETYVGIRKTRHSAETKQSSHILQEFFNRKINHSHPAHSESGAPATINTTAHVCWRLHVSWV